MCKDQDLFGDVIVTLDDVEFWLNNVPMHFSKSPAHRANYAKYWNVASKIIAAKLCGLFDRMMDESHQQNIDVNEYLKPIYCDYA